MDAATEPAMCAEPPTSPEGLQHVAIQDPLNIIGMWLQCKMGFSNNLVVEI